MKFSTTPLLIALQFGFFMVAVHGARRTGALTARSVRAVYVLAGVLLLWISASAVFAVTGVYDSQAFLALLPGFWISLVPGAIIGGALAVSSEVRAAISRAPEHVPAHWFVLIHAARIAALGTLIKTVRGEFPLAFELGLGVMDLLFGFSALYMAHRVKRGAVSRRGLLTWQLIGAAVILLPGSVMLQLGLPGPVQIFTRLPDNTALFDFPMVLAPTFIVPTFVAFNLWHAWYLWARSPDLRRAATGDGGSASSGPPPA